MVSLYEMVMRDRPAKAPRSKRVCKFCSGPFGMARPHDPFCSAYCEAWFDHPHNQLTYQADTVAANR